MHHIIISWFYEPKVVRRTCIAANHYEKSTVVDLDANGGPAVLSLGGFSIFVALVDEKSQNSRVMTKLQSIIKADFICLSRHFVSNHES